MSKIYDHLLKEEDGSYTRCTIPHKTTKTQQLVITEHGQEQWCEEHNLIPSDKTVIDFIELCHEIVGTGRPHCFAFAAILKEKFPSADIKDDCDHVITKIFGAYYDWNGIIKEGTHILLREYGDRWLARTLESTMSHSQNDEKLAVLASSEN